jgi:hypothetical protein
MDAVIEKTGTNSLMYESLRNEDKEEFYGICFVLFFKKPKRNNEQVNSKEKQ